MAGLLRAISSKAPSSLEIYSLHRDQHFHYSPPFRLCNPRNSSSRCSITQARKMDAKDQNRNIIRHRIDQQSTKVNDGDGNSRDLNSLLRVKKLSINAVLPSRASSLSAGYDLSSAVETKVPARGKALVQTDISIAIPEGTYARIAPRSGLAWKNSIDVGAGVIDADYRGPVGVILFNHSDLEFEVKVGDRIAQLIIEKIATPDVLEVEDLDSSIRGKNGFGSTGI